jgi:hypothetical protein
MWDPSPPTPSPKNRRGGLTTENLPNPPLQGEGHTGRWVMSGVETPLYETKATFVAYTLEAQSRNGLSTWGGITRSLCRAAGCPIPRTNR